MTQLVAGRSSLVDRIKRTTHEDTGWQALMSRRVYVDGPTHKIDTITEKIREAWAQSRVH